MYSSELNIKHTNRTHLYWGIDKTTGEVVGINSVRVRGLHCNCKCAACGGDFIARKGEKNKSHFAHQSNYECVYANEIAMYLYAQKVLMLGSKMVLPQISVKIGCRNELAKNEWEATVGNVYYHCEREQYPPLLLAEMDNQLTRIILAFDKYYSTEDYQMLRAEAKEKGWECIAIAIPKITESKALNPDLLCRAIEGNAQEKTWIYSKRAARWERRLRDAAITPEQPFPDSWGTAYVCPIHRQEREGKFYARPVDCDGCQFNLSLYPKTKCLAASGIRRLKDFKTPVDVRMDYVSKLQRENDERRVIILQEQERHEKMRQFKKLNTYYSNQKMKKIPPTELSVSLEEKRRLGRLEVMDRMEKPSDVPVFDQFNVRWIKCTRCGRIQPSEEMSSYGGRGSANMGVCRECSR